MQVELIILLMLMRLLGQEVSCSLDVDQVRC